MGRNPQYFQWEQILNIFNGNKSLLFQWEEILNIFNRTKSLIHTEHGRTHRKTTSYCLAQQRVNRDYLLAIIVADTAETYHVSSKEFATFAFLFRQMLAILRRSVVSTLKASSRRLENARIDPARIRRPKLAAQLASKGRCSVRLPRGNVSADPS